MEQLKGSEGTSLQEGDLWVGFEEGQCNMEGLVGVGNVSMAVLGRSQAELDCSSVGRVLT